MNAADIVFELIKHSPTSRVGTELDASGRIVALRVSSTDADLDRQWRFTPDDGNPRIDELKNFIRELVKNTEPVGWPGDRVAVYRTHGGMEFTVVFNTSKEIGTVGYNGKTIIF